MLGARRNGNRQAWIDGNFAATFPDGRYRSCWYQLGTPRDHFAASEAAVISQLQAWRDDGTTLSGCWIYAGAWTQQGNMMARRDNSDPTGIGQTLNWAWAWPANRRVLYNRASADPAGRPCSDS